MNALVLVALVAAVSALAALAWAVRERLRAASAEARVRMLEEQAELVQAQAARSAESVAEAILKRNEETLHNREQLAQARLEAQLKPVAETLQKYQEQLAAVEKVRAEETGGLKEQIAQLLQASSATQEEARKLSAALRRGAGVQGRWGEQTLRNVLEAAGLARRFDFEEQFSVESEEGRRRPDVKVRLPGGAVFVIDAKCSLNAFLELQDAPDEAARATALSRHVQSVRGHIQGLSAKAYWDQFKAEGSPDFVAMFVPGDGFLAVAAERQPELLSEAMAQKVVIASPTTLFALCKAVAYGWRVEDQAKSAAEVAKLGKELYKRLADMGAHAASVGKALEAAVSRYNAFVGSLESRVMPQARRFEELAADHEGKELPELTPIETAVRPISRGADPALSPPEEDAA